MRDDSMILDGLAKAQAAQAAVADMQAACHDVAAGCGWWHNPETGELKERNKGELVALMHSELSEALEGIRKDRMDDKLPHRKMEEVELADTILRIFDYAERFGLDVAGAMVEKLQFNAGREDHKPENRAAAGGKQF